MQSHKIDQQILGLAVQLGLLPEGGLMKPEEDSSVQTIVVAWIESAQKNAPIYRSMDRISYDALNDYGIDEQQAEKNMKQYCEELREGKNREGKPLSTADRLDRLAFLSAMTGQGRFGSNLNYQKKIYGLLNDLAKLAKGTEENNTKAERFLKLLAQLKQKPSEEKAALVERLETVIQCIDEEKTDAKSKDFFEACFNRIELQLSDHYKKHIKTLESELVEYKKYLENFGKIQSEAVKLEVDERIRICEGLIQKCSDKSPIEDRLQFISEGIKHLEQDLTSKEVKGPPFEKPSKYSGLHTTFNAFLDFVAQYIPVAANYKITGLSSTKTHSFEVDEVKENVRNAFKH